MNKLLKGKVCVYISIALTLMVIVFCSTMAISYAKFVSTQTSSVTSSVAGFNFSIGDLESGEETYTLVLNELSPSSLNQTYSFDITNGTNVNFAEVVIQYKISLFSTKNIPLDITVYDDSDNIVASLNPSTTMTSSYIMLAGGEFSKNDYSLTIGWNTDEGNSNARYQNLVDVIDICVEWTQID